MLMMIAMTCNDIQDSELLGPTI